MGAGDVNLKDDENLPAGDYVGKSVFATRTGDEYAARVLMKREAPP